jgi:hypothetical protein
VRSWCSVCELVIMEVRRRVLIAGYTAVTVESLLGSVGHEN